jgi:hypothetical protein
MMHDTADDRRTKDKSAQGAAIIFYYAGSPEFYSTQYGILCFCVVASIIFYNVLIVICYCRIILWRTECRWVSVAAGTARVA